MADKQPIYNSAVKSIPFLPVTPPQNKEYFIVTESQAEKAFSKWKDITKTTNANTFEYRKNVNQRILKYVYGGNGTNGDLVSTGYSKKYGPVTYGGVAVKDEDVQIVPGTKAYFEFNHYNGQPKEKRAKLLEVQKKLVEKEKIKEEEKPVNEEIKEFDLEASELKRESDIAKAITKPEISNVLKKQIIDDEDSDLDDILIGTSLNEKDLTPVNQVNKDKIVENFTPPITTDKPDEVTKVPPVIINHSECGHLTFGDEKDGETERPRDVGLYAGDSNALRLFRDGGFELRSSESQGENKIKGSSIMQVCNNATLLVNSEGDVIIRARNKLKLVADTIEIEAKNASEDGVTIMAEHDIKLRANNNTIITSDNITIDAKERIVSHSEGWQILIGQCIRLHEPQTKICPAFMKEYIDGQIKTLKG